MSTAYKYLKPSDIRRLKNYEFGAKAMVEGYLSGRHRSRQRGASIEFHEFRQYAPGDDPARVDWRVFARNDKLFLRTFEQETNLECHVFLDCSASMGFPEARGVNLTKLEYASFFAAALSWWVISKNDRVSLTLFDNGLRRFLPPGSTRRHLHDILTTLENTVPSAVTSLPDTLTRAHSLLKRRGTLVILSDFFMEPAALFKALNPYLHRGFNVHLFHVLAPEELHLEERALSRFVDMETGQRLTLHPRLVQAAWRDELQRHIRALRTLAISRKADYAQVSTAESYFTLFDRLRDK
ncbi:MAG: DUF58 domain-containing protein [Puniceicoccales bacterium]|nr:DUF58 domain-containing protein [Puniceicoccales bacterium]